MRFMVNEIYEKNLSKFVENVGKIKNVNYIYGILWWIYWTLTKFMGKLDSIFMEILWNLMEILIQSIVMTLMKNFDQKFMENFNIK